MPCESLGSASFLVVPLTSRLHLADCRAMFSSPGKVTGLPKASVANVYDVQKALRADFLERAGALPAESLARLDAGLRLVLHL